MYHRHHRWLLLMLKHNNIQDDLYWQVTARSVDKIRNDVQLAWFLYGSYGSPWVSLDARDSVRSG